MKLEPSDPNIETLISRIENKKINLQPDFQRGEVWGLAKKQRLIDTILRGWHVPPIHIVVDQNTGSRDVLDGQQRLAAIRDFVREDFAVNGDQEPYSEIIAQLDGFFYSDLPSSIKADFNDYPIRTFQLTDYSAEEPGELFYRLNQPANLTSAEQRNAFFGTIRQQVKELVSYAEDIGVNKDLLGFSNSRMAYDDVIAKVALTAERGTFYKKVTGGTVTERYRDGKPLDESVITALKKSIKIFALANDKSRIKIRFNKATWYSWLLVIYQWLEYGADSHQAESGAGKLIREFATLSLNSDYLDENNHHTELYTRLISMYSDRATSRVADVSSVLIRDFVLWAITIDFDASLDILAKNAQTRTLLMEFNNSRSRIGDLDQSLIKLLEEYSWDILS